MMGKTELDGFTANSAPNWPFWMFIKFAPKPCAFWPLGLDNWRLQARALEEIGCQATLELPEGIIGNWPGGATCLLQGCPREEQWGELHGSWSLALRAGCPWIEGGGRARAAPEDYQQSHWAGLIGGLYLARFSAVSIFFVQAAPYASSETWNHIYICQALIVGALKHVHAFAF